MSQRRQIQLNDLPHEILEIVFEYLEVTYLLKSSLVCKKWNGIIGQSQVIMKKIGLDVSFEDIKLLPKEFTRKYRKIKISWMSIDSNLKKLLEGQDSNLRILELDQCEIRSDDNLFNSSTKLETLRITNSNCYIDLRNLDSLTSLDLGLGKVGIQKFPETAQLKCLRMYGLEDYDFFRLISFLPRQKNLEELIIGRSKHTLDNNLETLHAIQFPLKKLSIIGHELFGSEENKLIFMKKFVNSLEELSITRSSSRSMYEMVFNEFNKLYTLKVFMNDASEEDFFYSNVHPNLSVKKLVVYGSPGLNWIEGFINKLPNLHTLDLGIFQPSTRLMRFVANNLTMLNDLQVERISDQAFEGVNFPSLKKFRVMKFDSFKSQNWHQMIITMPNIEEFEVKRFCKNQILDDESIKTMTKGWPQLKHVKLGKGFVASKKIFDLLLQNFKDLKTIEICKKAFNSNFEKEEILREVERDGFTFVVIDA